MISVNEPLFESCEKELLCQCIETGWVSSDGKFVKEFENEFANYIGMKHGVSVCNGTVALELAINVLDLKPGDEIIIPAFTIVSCVYAALKNKLKPILVDVDLGNWNMDVNQVEEKITEKTRVIMPVHIYGHPVDMDPILDLAEKYDLFVIEDAAEVHGALYKGKKCGSIGHASVFSFYANKIITTGEGGMVLTDDDNIAAKLRSRRNLAFQSKQRFFHEEEGYNFRFTNFQAAVGVAQMKKVDWLVNRKIEQGKYYRARLEKIKGIKLQKIKPWASSVYWVNGIVLDDEVDMDAFELAELLKKREVQTRPFFWPMHEQPVFNEQGLFNNENYPISEKLARRGLYLPSGMALTEKQIDYVCEQLYECLRDC